MWSMGQHGVRARAARALSAHASQAEMGFVEARERFAVLADLYLRNCGEHREELGHQMFVLQKLEEASARALPRCMQRRPVLPVYVGVLTPNLAAWRRWQRR